MRTAPCEFTLDELWFIHDSVTPSLMNMEHRKATIDATRKIEEGILFCDWTAEGKASIQLDTHDILLLLGTVNSAAKDVNGKPMGRDVVYALMATRAAIEDTQFDDAVDGDISYSEAMEKGGK